MGVLAMMFGGKQGLVKTYDAELERALGAIETVVAVLIEQKGMKASAEAIHAVMRHLLAGAPLPETWQKGVKPVLSALAAWQVSGTLTNIMAVRLTLLKMVGRTAEISAIVGNLSSIDLLKQTDLPWPTLPVLRRAVDQCIVDCQKKAAALRKAAVEKVARHDALVQKCNALLKETRLGRSAKEALVASLRVEMPEGEELDHRREVISQLAELALSGRITEQGFLVLIQKIPGGAIPGWRVDPGGFLVECSSGGSMYASRWSVHTTHHLPDGTLGLQKSEKFSLAEPAEQLFGRREFALVP